MSAKQKCVRCTLSLFLLILFLVFAVIVFGIFAGSEASLYSDHYGHLRYQDIVNSNDPLKVKSFCIELSVTNISNYPECDPYFSDFVSYTILYVSFPLTVIIFKMIFALLMKKLVALRRHKDEVYRICWKITILTLFYCSTCGGIKWFIYRSFSVGSIKFELLTLFEPILSQVAKVIPINPYGHHLYQDFDKHWVAHASHKVILVGIFSFNIVILIYHFTNLFSKKCNESSASNEPTHKKMKEKLKGQIFNIEFIYA